MKNLIMSFQHLLAMFGATVLVPLLTGLDIATTLLMAGLDGVKNKIDPHANGWGPYDMNLYHLPEEEKAKLKSLPTNLNDALDALEADHDYLTAGGVFPEHLIKNFIAVKRKECMEMAKIPHPAEFDRYFNL